VADGTVDLGWIREPRMLVDGADRRGITGVWFAVPRRGGQAPSPWGNASRGASEVGVGRASMRMLERRAWH
jgi:hypothetical protein